MPIQAFLLFQAGNGIPQSTNFKEDEWVCKVARTVEEAKQLIKAGFEYIDTIDGFHLYRKRK